MRQMILAAAAVLSLATGSSYAATINGPAANSTVTAVTTTHQPVPLYVGPVPNPWDGSESWKQWNLDHPGDSGGN